ncbi:hypothetical protein LTR86_002668 [Recurvomyces mirabilis]|nr:hypothetical protein LTR86_002668 [Recurvomyces mirabilis]
MPPPIRAGVPQKKGRIGQDGKTDAQRRADNFWTYLCPVEFCPYHPSRKTELESHLNTGRKSIAADKIRILCTGCRYLFCTLDAYTHHRCQNFPEKAPVPSTEVLQQRGIAFDPRPIPDSDKNAALLASMRAISNTPSRMTATVNIQPPPTLPPPTHHYQGQQLPQQPVLTKAPNSCFGQMHKPLNLDSHFPHHNTAASRYLGDLSQDTQSLHHLQHNTQQADQQSASGTIQCSGDANHDYATLEGIDTYTCLDFDPRYEYDFDDGGVMEGLMNQMTFPMAVAAGPDTRTEQVAPNHGLEPWAWVLKEEMHSPIIDPQLTTPRKQATVAG